MTTVARKKPGVPAAYTGPVAPPPAELLDGAISWRILKRQSTVDRDRWVECGYVIHYGDHEVEWTLDGIGMAVRTVFAP